MNAEPDQGEKKIWFPAKKYGWGWGPPNCWQGWVVIVIYVGLAAGGAFLFLLTKPPAAFHQLHGGVTAAVVRRLLVQRRETALALGRKIISFIACTVRVCRVFRGKVKLDRMSY